MHIGPMRWTLPCAGVYEDPLILLHELGHIDCACNDENRADKFADQHYYRGERK